MAQQLQMFTMRTLLSASAALGLMTAAAFAPVRPVSMDPLPSYGAWPKVTPRPLRLPTASDTLCIGPITPAQFVESSSHNPHRRKVYEKDNSGKHVRKEKRFLVYVNEIGTPAMTAQARPSFPEGTIIVKEKLPPDSTLPELRTVMLKRERGYDPKNGDWEYLVYGPGTRPRLMARGHLPNCVSCHAQKSKTDFVFRTYLSIKTRQRLR